MNQIPFQELELTPELSRAVAELGFETATDIQAQTIPLIKAGYDVIGRSQTGTGKTLAFGIPAVESIDTQEQKNSIQVLILCPTRELAMQACVELKKLAKYRPGVKIADIYGGAPMERQIIKLKSGVNIVVGTPGRVMDHMRRKTIRLNNLKMMILDEADEMLSMGFREDIETILQDAPEERQTILFSATMPPAILEITNQYQKDPQIIEINKKQVTVENISQYYCEVPMGRKKDALNLLLRYYAPKRTLIFCNTKSMVEEIQEYLADAGYDAEGLHGDMKQQQRTKVMDAFKAGRVSILIATDVAARGIHVDDINYVFNYDIPQNPEYYVHRIGRAGRAGKSGKAVTICSGRRQAVEIKMLARLTKSTIEFQKLPTVEQAVVSALEANLQKAAEYIDSHSELVYEEKLSQLTEKGYSLEKIAAAALELHFGQPQLDMGDIKSAYGQSVSGFEKAPSGGGRHGYSSMAKISLNIGRNQHVAPNHIVAAMAEQTPLSGGDIGKIEIYDNKTIVGVPESELENVLNALKGASVCGQKITAAPYGGLKSPFERDASAPDFEPKDYRKLLRPARPPRAAAV